ncbi:DUF2730 domain-containing protein [Pseudoruegeria sp. HB172150]|uniref:DUF2730 domain-containing protein n=1 Tax=Pseudoruegeria sp. HB172150 TaxID=2721164 RepID=UPI001554A741|nr:DUF2730 domain-containing protein [Pseudoruegeria sp. HB172150]
MTVGEINQYVGLLSFLISTGVGIFAFFATRRKDVDRRFDEGSKRMDRHDLRIQSLEDKQKNAPGQLELHSLQLELAKMTGSIGKIEAIIEGNAKIMTRLEQIVTRHEDHLLGGSK